MSTTNDSPAPRVTRRRVVADIWIVKDGDFWRTTDGRFTVARDNTYVTYCEGPHPCRISADDRRLYAESPRRLPDYIANAIRAGKSGYLCPGDEPHTYAMWEVWPGDDTRGEVLARTEGFPIEDLRGRY